MARGVAFALLYAAYVGSIVLTVHYLLFWRPFVNALRETSKPSMAAPDTTWVSAEVARHLGIVLVDKRSSFSRFAETKTDGITRVCAFGDSFTHGDEVDETHDFPSILQGLFERRGFTDVEVINFGNPWYGFHQSYILWDLVGRRYSCDYLLLGPEGFFPERDVTFNHTRLILPYYLHSRFILEGSDLRLVTVLGDTHAERFDHYFNFFPHWTYLRYDRNPPSVVMAALPKGRTVANPFYYYSGSIDEEAFATHRILLRRLAESGAQVVVLHRDAEVRRMADELARPTLVAVEVLKHDSFPYRAPKDHYSEWGNRSIAEQFYALLVGNSKREVDALATEDAAPRADASSEAAAPPLSHYDRVEVQLAGVTVGLFVVPGPAGLLRSPAASDFHSSDVVSLLALKDESTAIVDACFVPLNFAPEDGARVMLRPSGLHSGGEIGQVRRLRHDVNVGVVQVAGLTCRWPQILGFRGNANILLTSLDRAGEVAIDVGDHAILVGQFRGDAIALSPIAGSMLAIRAVSASLGDVDELPASPEIELVLHRREGTPIRIPIARWTKTTVDIPQPARALPKTLAPLRRDVR